MLSVPSTGLAKFSGGKDVTRNYILGQFLLDGTQGERVEQ